MKKLFWACVLALPLLALPSQARAWDLAGYQVDTGAKVWFNVRRSGWDTHGYPNPMAGPWYLYWPYEAQFQAATPGINPYFPPPMTLPPGFGPRPPAMPPAAPAYVPPPPAPVPPPQQGYRYPARLGMQPAAYYPFR